MATKFKRYSGTVKWAKVYEGQEDQKYGHYGLDFYPDDVEDFKSSGVQLQERTDEEGGVFFKLRRTPKKLIKDKVVDFGTPLVLDAEGEPFDKPIGNGSKVTVKIAVYDTVKGLGHRLEAVRVDEWVEYKKEEGASDGGPNTPKFPF